MTGQSATAAIAATMIDVRDYKAVGDGKADDTAGLSRKPSTQPPRRRRPSTFPEGVFRRSTLKNARLMSGSRGTRRANYHGDAGSTLRLWDKSAARLIDITGAVGVRLAGLTLDGKGLGSGVHGVLLNKPDYGPREDTLFIENCRISNFTGDGI